MSLLIVDLTAIERRLCEAAAEGRLLDLSTGQPDDDDPSQAPAGPPIARSAPR